METGRHVPIKSGCPSTVVTVQLRSGALSKATFVALFFNEPVCFILKIAIEYISYYYRIDVDQDLQATNVCMQPGISYSTFEPTLFNFI